MKICKTFSFHSVRNAEPPELKAAERSESIFIQSLYLLMSDRLGRQAVEEEKWCLVP